MKADKEHEVPLSRPAINLLKALPRFEGCVYVFPAARGGQLSDMALNAVTRRMEGRCCASWLPVYIQGLGAKLNGLC